MDRTQTKLGEAPMVSGQSLIDTRAAFEQVVGVETVRRAIASLPAEVQDAYMSATTLSWIDLSVPRSVHDAISRESGVPVEELLEKVIPLSIERSFKTVWRIFLRFTSDEALVNRCAAIYSRSRSRGTMTARFLGDGMGIAEIRDWASIPQREILVLGISIRTFLGLAGRENVQVTGERTAVGAKWTLRFRA